MGLRHPVQQDPFLKQSAIHYNTLQHTATHCNTLQHTATHCNTLQQDPFLKQCVQQSLSEEFFTNCSTLQHAATHCNTLQQDPFLKQCVQQSLRLLITGWLQLVGSFKLQVSFAKEPLNALYKTAIELTLLDIWLPYALVRAHANEDTLIRQQKSPKISCSFADRDLCPQMSH